MDRFLFSVSIILYLRKNAYVKHTFEVGNLSPCEVLNNFVNHRLCQQLVQFPHRETLALHS